MCTCSCLLLHWIGSTLVSLFVTEFSLQFLSSLIPWLTVLALYSELGCFLSHRKSLRLEHNTSLNVSRTGSGRFSIVSIWLFAYLSPALCHHLIRPGGPHAHYVAEVGLLLMILPPRCMCRDDRCMPPHWALPFSWLVFLPRLSVVMIGLFGGFKT